MGFVFWFIILGVLFFIISNVMIYKFIINKARRYYLQPYFRMKNLSIYQISFPGFFNTGDFETPLFEIVPVAGNGKIFNNTFANVFVEDNSGKQYKYSVEIKTIFLKINKVILKSNQMNLETELPRST